MAEIFVLVSENRHKSSGNPRYSRQDAKAIEIAINLAEINKMAATVVHAGNPDNKILREYLGMGLKSLIALPVPADADVVITLGDYLQKREPRLLLCGRQADGMESSGMLPYLLAKRLNMPIASDITDIAINSESGQFKQALPRGLSQQLRLRLPAVATIISPTNKPTQFAFAQARRGRVIIEKAHFEIDQRPSTWQIKTIKKRIKYIKGPSGKSAHERVLAATQSATSGNKTIIETNPRDSALTILSELEKTGVRPKTP